MAALTEEQSMLRDQAKSWVTEQSPVVKFRAMRDSGVELKYTPTTWEAMVEMGWTGILVPEEFGGSDLGYLTFGVVLEELGRQLTASPLFASALVGTSAVLLAGNDQQKQALLPKVVDGSEILSLAVDETARHAPAQTALQATAADGGFTLQGEKTFVMEGMAATTFIVAARTSGTAGDESGITLFLVAADAAGLDRSSIHTVDSRGYAHLNFNNVVVAADSVLGQVDAGYADLQAVLDRASAGVAAEMLGTGAQAFDMTLEYLKTREQFGRVIGSFQALGHRAAELYTAMELARSCAEHALEAIDSNADNLAEVCSLSKCRVGDFLHVMSNQLIQIHGGIGMTDEFDAGFYLKRARVLETAFGNQAYHRDRYAKALGFQASAFLCIAGHPASIGKNKKNMSETTNPEHSEKIYINADELLRDSFALALKVLESGFRPDFIVAVWRGGTPVGIAVQELMKYAGNDTDHIAIRTSYYQGIDKTDNQVQVHNLGYLLEHLNYDNSVLIVDDVFDRGRSIEAIISELQRLTRRNLPKDIRIATVWFKPEKNVTALTPDYYVHETNRWLVFPHELDGLTDEEVRVGKPLVAELVFAATQAAGKAPG